MSIEAIRELETLASVCPELNMANYTEDDVRHLNDWAIEMSLLVERYTLSQQPAAAIACGIPGMAKTTCPYCEQGFAFEHEQPATGEPVAWMASYVDPIGNDHVYVTSHHDLAVENDMHGTPRPLVFGDTHPAPSVLKDDQIAALVNKVRDIARMFNDHQSLRERIAIELVPALKVSQEVKSDAERGRFLIEWLRRYGLLQAEFGQMGVGEKPENWWLLHAPWGIDQTRPFLGHGKTPEQAIDAAKDAT